ncbi:MAG: thiamine pyrophosphate-dependent enzyme [Gammaproteobacteria bacterium]|nr:thiamine pyrophosphate-dependent enzyme [Gammaproteobacteria bacterium]
MSSKAGLARKATRGINRVEIVDRNFTDFVEAWDEEIPAADIDARVPGTGLNGRGFLELVESQMLSRHLDIEARAMRARNEGFYTIGSSGHEGNVLLGRLTRRTDPAFLHYRSGAFFIERARQLQGIDPVYDIALSLAASLEDPASGGRHKVFGSAPLWVPPQTSTIASHLPKAMGAASAIAESKRAGCLPVPADSIVVCSFGDASTNHATAQSAFNAAAWRAFQNLPCPILFVCEDNGLGISVETPPGWVGANFSRRPGLHYIKADGLDIAAGYRAVASAVEYCRSERAPVFLHLRAVRLLGHAGTDIDMEYLGADRVEATEANDPLLFSAETALELGLATPAALLERYEACRERVQEASRRAVRRPRLNTAKQVTATLAPCDARKVKREAERVDFEQSPPVPDAAPARHLSIQINRALAEMMTKYPEASLFGEDVAGKGGVYTVTSGLFRKFGGARVFNTLLDETAILGIAQGQAMMGLLPLPEIQYLAYLHNALDQIRGEAASLQFFSNNQYANGMVVRIAALAYQKGFGGHFHNDNSFAALRDIPGLVIACPSRGDDAVAMLRTAAALARVNGRVVAWLEPIALYMTKDLYAAHDGGWLFDYPAPGKAAGFGEPRVYHARAKDLLIVTFGNGVPMALRAAKQLREETGKGVRILDLRWLKPLNVEAVAKHANACGRILVVDEGRRTGGIAEEIFTALDEHCDASLRKARVAGADSFIPLGEAANFVLVQDADILEAARNLLG